MRRLKSNALINECCLELKKGKAGGKCCGQATQRDENGRTAKKSKVIRVATSQKCPYNSQPGVEQLSAIAVASEAVVDIEELIRAGKEEQACPYYAARRAAEDAQLIMLPYQMLLHKKTRQQMNLNLSQSVVIIDEAHNLLDTISAIHSAEIRFDHMQQSQRLLTAYKNQYISRFSARNLLRLNQLISIAQRLLKLFTVTASEPTSRMIHVHELLDDANISHTNLAEILRFCEDTRLAQKVHGFALRHGAKGVEIAAEKPKQTPTSYLKSLAERKMNGEKGVVAKPAETVAVKMPNESIESTSALRILITFLDCLLEESTDGRVLISADAVLKSNSFLKYLLLNPSSRFGDVLKECRAVIVAGGTMQPTTEFSQQLFQADRDRIEEHFFGHVVAADAVLPLVVSKGPKNSSFLFNFANRSNKQMVSVNKMLESFH